MIDITYKPINEELKLKISRIFGEWTNDYLKLNQDNYNLAALYMEEPIGFIAVTPHQFMEVLPITNDAYVSYIEVSIKFRRCGIAAKLLKQAEEWAAENGYYQMRTFCSMERKGVFKLWYSLNYCLCPAKIVTEGSKKPVVGYFALKKL